MAGGVIVVVDDDGDTLEYMEMLLSWHGYQPVGLPTTTGALNRIRQARPALVILDLELEQPDAGLVLLRRLRADPATATLPAILYSAHEYALRSFQPELRALRCATLFKPFAPDDLLGLMESVLASPLGPAPP